jgi:hypothetical protein
LGIDIAKFIIILLIANFLNKVRALKLEILVLRLEIKFYHSIKKKCFAPFFYNSLVAKN